MSSFFEDILSFDRPWVDVTIKLPGVEKKAKARRPSAMESDALDAYYADTYAAFIVKETDPNNSGAELGRLRSIYSKAPLDDIIEQLIATRSSELQRKSLEAAGFDVRELSLRFLDSTPEQRSAFDKDNDEALKAGLKRATEEMKAEYTVRAPEEVVETLCQVTVNFTAMKQARRLQQCEYLTHTLFDLESNKVFDKVESVRELSEEAVNTIFEAVHSALEEQTPSDLPFVSPPAPEPSGPQLSLNTSEEATATGGARTKTTPASSKRSTTRASVK